MIRRRQDDTLKAELDAHLAMDVEARIARGVPPDEAVAAARRELGNISQIEEAARDAWGGRWLDHLAQDARYALRVLRKNPAYTLIAVLSLALGIGANTALFEVVDAIRLQTLPVVDPSRLVDVHISDMTGARGSRQSWNPAVTQPIWRELSARQQAFAALIASARDEFDASSGGEVRPVEGLWVSGEYFATLGIRPTLGRLLTSADDGATCAARAVLGYGFWERAYGKAPGIVGKSITLDAHAVEVVGVAPRGFFGLEVGRAFDVALPLCAEPMFSSDGKGRRDAGTTWWLTVFGRLKPGWSLERASAQLAAISPEIFKASLPSGYPAASVGRYLAFKFAAYPAASGLSQLREPYGKPLWVLLAIAGLVLVIACANLANLLLARATARQREFAVRLSLGASRGRVIRQLLTESLLIAMLGTACAIFLAGALGRALVTFLGQSDNLLALTVGADWRVFVFAAALALATCLLFGLAPAIKSTRLAAATVMRVSARGATAGREAVSLRRSLVVAQVALSLTLLFGSLLFARTLINLTRLNPGFDSRGVVMVQLDATRLRLPPEQRQSFRRSLLDRVRALPGVQGAASVAVVPLSGDAFGNDFWPAQDRRATVNTLLNYVGAGYFTTLGIRMIEGRDFDSRDTATSQRVAIATRAFAKAMPHAAQVLGSTVVRESTPSTPEESYQIVGIVEDSTYLSLRDHIAPVLFLADTQARAGLSTQLLVRTALPPASVTSEITAAVGEMDPRIAISYGVLADQIRDTLMRERLLATLSGSFGALAVLLTLIGLYGLVAYAVTRRTNEIGVRIALGATHGHIARLLVRETGVLLVVGIVVGVALGLAAGRAAATLLFGVPPHDPVTLVAAVGVLLLVAAVATLLPARRAMRIEPVTALRIE